MIVIEFRSCSGNTVGSFCASILKMATGFRVTKDRVIKSTFDVKKKK